MSRRLVATFYSLLLLLACVPILVQAQTQQCQYGYVWDQVEQKCVSTNPIIRLIDNFIAWVRGLLGNVELPTLPTLPQVASQTKEQTLPTTQQTTAVVYQTATVTQTTTERSLGTPVTSATTTYTTNTDTISVLLAGDVIFEGGRHKLSQFGGLLKTPLNFANGNLEMYADEHLGTPVSVVGYWLDPNHVEFMVTSMMSMTEQL